MSADRESLGRVVRETWVAWALEQPDPKPSWLTGWDELDDGQREVDMRIGEAVAAIERERIKGLFDEWITLAMAEPNSHPPEAWKFAFADLISDEPQFKVASAPPPADIRPRDGEPGWHDVTCGACGEEFGTNFRVEEIECAECEARRCPECATWFGGEGDES